MTTPTGLVDGTESELVTPADAASALQVTVELVDHLVGAGALRALLRSGKRFVVAGDVDRLHRGLESLRSGSDDVLLTPKEVAVRFGVRPKTVLGWAQSGRLPAVRTLGGHRRFRELDVLRLLTPPRRG